MSSNRSTDKRVTLRDALAMAALQGMLASAPMCDRTKVNKLKWAKAAYDWATAMLVMRRKGLKQ